MKNEYIKNWIKHALTVTKSINKNASSSYGLKHICEESIGCYVSNDEIIDAMIDLGFKYSSNHINYHFNISKIINNVSFKNKLGREYNSQNRCFNKRSKEILL